MARAISVRLDEEAPSALTLLEAAGLSRSQAIRRALVDAAARLRDKKALAAEVAALEADDADRAEMLIAPPSRSARPASFRPEVEIEGVSTRVLVEQVGAVDVGRLGELLGHVTPEEQWGVDAALMTVLGLA